MKRIPSDTAFTLWTAAAAFRRIKRDPHRRTIEIIQPGKSDCDSYFVPGSYLHVIHRGLHGNYEVR